MNKIHTNKSYEGELHFLRDRILFIADLVEKIISKSIEALTQNDIALAKSTILSDREIDKEELLIDELCINMLARRQPLGQDLRFVVSVLKMVTSFERLGDLAVNICQRVIKLKGAQNDLPLDDLIKMAEGVQGMIAETLDAFLTRDAKKALLILEKDSAIDELYHGSMRRYVSEMGQRQTGAENFLHLLSIAKWLERMGDHCTNVAELIIFMVKGEDVRHSQIQHQKASVLASSKD